MSTTHAGDTIDVGDGIVSQTGFIYQWSSLNGYNPPPGANPPPHTPISNDTFTLTVTTDAGCQDTQSFDVVVVDKPIISFIEDDFTICEGETFTITTEWQLFKILTAMCGPLMLDMETLITKLIDPYIHTKLSCRKCWRGYIDSNSD